MSIRLSGTRIAKEQSAIPIRGKFSDLRTIGKESGVDSWRVDAGLDYMLMRERIEEFLCSRPGAYCANCVGRELPAIPRFVHDAIEGMRSRKFVVGDVVCAGCGERKQTIRINVDALG